MQLAPSIEDQASAILDILVVYDWKQFSIVTTPLAGHEDFEQAVRRQMLDYEKKIKIK